MNPLLIGALVSFSLAMTGVALGNMIWFRMIGEVNRKRGDDKLISYFGVTPGKGLKLLDEYQRLYPNGRAHLYLYAAAALVFLGMATAFVLGSMYGAATSATEAPVR
jgi:hypothetical protein